MARILCPLSPGGRDRLDFLQRAGRSDRTSLAGHDAVALSFHLQIAARNHARTPAARLSHGIDGVPARARAARGETPSRAHSIASLLCAEGRENRLPAIRRAIA